MLAPPHAFVMLDVNSSDNADPALQNQKLPGTHVTGTRTTERLN